MPLAFAYAFVNFNQKHYLVLTPLLFPSFQCGLPPLTPQTPLTPDSLGQMSPHPGMSAAFTYPSTAPSSYESLPPTTPTQTAVSPILTYQQQGHVAWSSGTTALPTFDHTTGDYSSPSIVSHTLHYTHFNSLNVFLKCLGM